MTIERAIEILDPTHREDFYNQPDGLEQISEAMRMGMEALKKRRPVKPVELKGVYALRKCPTCWFETTKFDKYCRKCGQALDWGESNG